MLIEPIDEEDPIRIFNDIEKLRLTRNLFEISRSIRATDSKTKDYSISLICSWHKSLFDGVRDHAGRYRTTDYGEERLTFGSHRSVAREDVSVELNKHISVTNNLLAQLQELDEKITPLQFVEECIKAALYLHAEFIKIHPFRDGNGRVGRLIITFILSKFDLPPLAIEIPRQEYIQSLNHYYSFKQIDPLLQLALRIYKNQL